MSKHLEMINHMCLEKKAYRVWDVANRVHPDFPGNGEGVHPV